MNIQMKMVLQAPLFQSVPGGKNTVFRNILFHQPSPIQGINSYYKSRKAVLCTPNIHSIEPHTRYIKITVALNIALQ